MPCRVDADPERKVRGFLGEPRNAAYWNPGLGAFINRESHILTNTSSWWDKSDHSGVDEFRIGACLPPRVILRQDLLIGAGLPFRT